MNSEKMTGLFSVEPQHSSRMDFHPFGDIFADAPETQPQQQETLEQLFGEVTNVLSANTHSDVTGFGQELSSFEPTPINPSAITYVDQVPLQGTSTGLQNDFMKQMKLLIHNREQQLLPSMLPNTMYDHNTPCSSLPSTHYPASHDENVSLVSYGTSTSLGGDSEGGSRSSHIEQWNQRFQELVEFRREFQHCQVPLNWELRANITI